MSSLSQAVDLEAKGSRRENFEALGFDDSGLDYSGLDDFWISVFGTPARGAAD